MLTMYFKYALNNAFLRNYQEVYEQQHIKMVVLNQLEKQMLNFKVVEQIA